jgi:hypothetical protein
LPCPIRWSKLFIRTLREAPADAVGTNPETGATEIVQVYRPTPAGNIPKRERDAARDIQGSTGIAPTMVPVRPVKPIPPTPQQPNPPKLEP